MHIIVRDYLHDGERETLVVRLSDNPDVGNVVIAIAQSPTYARDMVNALNGELVANPEPPRTLLDVAHWAEQQHRSIDCEIVDGGLRNGRTERCVAVEGILRGMVTLTQGTTADKVFVRPADADKVIVRVQS